MLFESCNRNEQLAVAKPIYAAGEGEVETVKMMKAFVHVFVVVRKERKRGKNWGKGRVH